MENIIYVVEPGDTLEKIAKKFGTDVNTIARYNGIADINDIKAGQILRIAPRPGEKAEYTVQKGDTLYNIAKMWGTTAEKLAELNGIKNPDRLEVGRVIKLPYDGGDDIYIVKKGDNLFDIARMYNTTPEALADFNGITNPDSLEPGQILRIPGKDYMTALDKYTVRSGDSLWKIAQRFGTTVVDLINLNKLINPDLIYPGQVLILR